MRIIIFCKTIFNYLRNVFIWLGLKYKRRAWYNGNLTEIQKPWAWNTKEYWNEYPKHFVTDDLFWYYQIKIGYYFSVTASQFFDVKRKDFWLMFAHHIATILLLALSYLCNITRAGAVIILLHDSVDFWVQLGKLATHTKHKRIADVSLLTFSFVWLLTRLIIYPFW